LPTPAKNSGGAYGHTYAVVLPLPLYQASMAISSILKDIEIFRQTEIFTSALNLPFARILPTVDSPSQLAYRKQQIMLRANRQIFSTFAFAICYCPSVCRLSVCL